MQKNTPPASSSSNLPFIVSDNSKSLLQEYLGGPAPYQIVGMVNIITKSIDLIPMLMTNDHRAGANVIAIAKKNDYILDYEWSYLISSSQFNNVKQSPNMGHAIQNLIASNQLTKITMADIPTYTRNGRTYKYLPRLLVKIQYDENNQEYTFNKPGILSCFLLAMPYLGYTNNNHSELRGFIISASSGLDKIDWYSASMNPASSGHLVEPEYIGQITRAIKDATDQAIIKF